MIKFPELKKFLVDRKSNLKKVLKVINKNANGIALVVNHKLQLQGVVTDGDLRRLILNKQSPLPALLITSAIEFGTRSPKNIKENDTLSKAIVLMDESRIWDLPVLNDLGNVVGLLNRHNL
jgi:arabinose-5-phosphate isomerase